MNVDGHFILNFCSIFPFFCCSSASYPLVVAAHPQEPNQFAVGLTDGAVVIVEPLESEDKWGVPPPVDNGLQSVFHTTSPVNASSLDQP